MTQDIYLLIEHIQGQVSDISYIMTAAARDLSDKIGGSVCRSTYWAVDPRI